MSNIQLGAEVKVDEVIFDEALYPRSGFDQEIVNRYRQVVDLLPPIEITHENVLIDGYHRLIAHRIEQRETIKATVEELPRERVKWEAAGRNARFGFQLKQGDKRDLGREFYSENGRTIDEIAYQLGVTDRAVRDWTEDFRKDEEQKQHQKILELWLACKALKEIALEIDKDPSTVSRFLKDMQNGNISDLHILQEPESIQSFNLWNFQANDKRYGVDYPGRIPGQIVENALYYYTELFDTVVDPMAGGGTTLDVCKEMARRYRCYDIKPVRDDIKKHDVTTGLPSECKGCNLVFLDPPYWSQKQGDYSKDDTNLANLPLDEFYAAMGQIFESVHSTLADAGHIAVIMGPTQSKGVIYDHAFELAKLLELRFSFVNRVIVPYTTQQAKGYHVADAKEGRYMLKLYRDLLVYQK